MALFVTIYLSLMGRQGLKEAAEQSYAGAHYLAQQLTNTKGTRFMRSHAGDFFNEFVIHSNEPVDNILQRCLEHGYLAGVKVSDHELLLAVTEKRTKEEIDTLVNIMREEGV